MPVLPRRRTRPSKWTPEPPPGLPGARIVHVPGRGEFFLRDSGGDGTPVLLLHGWCFSADLNWFRAYGPLCDAGYRVLAVDHRGHGRGLRTPEPFTLGACAEDAARLLEHEGVGPVVAVGYSMGGPIAQLMARDHPETVRGLVLGATAQEWTDPRQKIVWRGLAALRLTLGLAPDRAWRRGLRLAGFPDSQLTTWVTAELTRGSASDLTEAGRELSRYDSRPWLAELDVPAAVIVTTKDLAVPPRKQHELAAALGAARLEVKGDHGAVSVEHRAFNAALLQALAAVGAPAAEPVARA